MTILSHEGGRMVSGNGHQKRRARSEVLHWQETFRQRNKRCSHTSSRWFFLWFGMVEFIRLSFIGGLAYPFRSTNKAAPSLRLFQKGGIYLLDPFPTHQFF